MTRMRLLSRIVDWLRLNWDWGQFLVDCVVIMLLVIIALEFLR